MKQILVLFLLCSFSFAHAASTKDANRVCKSMMNFKVQDQCTKFLIIVDRELMKKLGEVHYDSKAIELCSGVLNDSQKFRCIQKLPNKIYSELETERCGEYLKDGQIVSCLEESGTY